MHLFFWLKQSIFAVLYVLAVVLGASFIVFATLRLMMPTPSASLLSRFASDAQAAFFIQSLNADSRIGEGFLSLLQAYARGEWGNSWLNQLPIGPQIGDALKASVLLMLPGAIAAHVFAFVLASRRTRAHLAGSWRMLGAQISMAVGILLWALLAQYVLASTTFLEKPFPAFGLNTQTISDYLRSIAAPTLTIVLTLYGLNYAMYVGCLQNPERARAMQSAKALGFGAVRQQLASWRVLGFEIISYLIANVPAQLLAAALVLEIVFGVPGIARLSLTACLNSDAPLVMALTVCISAVLAMANISVQLLRSLLDPRLRLPGKAWAQ
jgi:peptide/nickel transport system permease protein